MSSEGQSALETSSSTVYPLGRYLVLAGLGRGGMADVYLALSRGVSGFSKLVVLKLLREHLAEDQEFLRMFIAEARLAARLNHPNIVQTYEIGIEDGRHCIVMEYLEGRSFADLETATAQTPIALNLGLRILADTLAGLHHAHERRDVNGNPLGLVHRDVSPHNVFITYDGQVKILDFGIAKAADDGAHTKTGVFKGKLRYTAPERFCGEEADRRADVFSVGVMLWQLLTQKRLWSGLTDLALMHQLANRIAVTPPRTIDPRIPEALEHICLKALAANAADRFQTAMEMQDAIEEYLSGESVRGSNRALGKFMCEVFGEKRAQFQRLVDQQTRAAAELPIDPMMSTASAARIRAPEVPLLDGAEGASSMRMPTSASRIKPPTFEGTGSGPSAINAHTLVSDRPPMRRKNRRGIGFVALAVVLLFIGGSLVVRASLTRDVPRTDSASAAAPQPVGVAPPREPTVAVPAIAPPATDDKPSAQAPANAGVTVPTGSTEPSAKHVPMVFRPVTNARPRAAGAADVRPSASEAAPAAKREVDCTSPYFIDEQGMKKVRVECL